MNRLNPRSNQHRLLRSSLKVAALAACAGLAGLSCTSTSKGGGGGGGDDFEEVPRASLEVEVTFPSDVASNTTATLHVWVLAPDESGETTCASLVGGDVDPYDFSHHRIGDAVSLEPSAGVSAEEVPIGEGLLVYVEAVDDLGHVEWAGCESIDLEQPGAEVTVTLGPARVYDCGDPATEDGAPCDDGLTCTVGEECRDGACGEGSPRSCDHIADGCNAASCDEELGCVTTLVPDGVPCEDGFFCTAGEVCTEGECVGVARDCQEEASQCRTALYCDETLDECITTEATSGTPCDDGLFCTIDDVCDFSGLCQGSPNYCTGNGCAVGTCDEISDECDFSSFVAQGVSCNDGDSYCTFSDVCDGAGNCIGTEQDCSAYEDECNVGICDPDSFGCTTQPVADGTPCVPDETGCYTPGTCQSGSCSGYGYEPLDTECQPTSCGYSGYCTGSSGSCFTLTYVDEDGDGYSPLGGPSCTSIDCDDTPVTGATIYPSSIRESTTYATCADGIDNDCDDLIDTADTLYCPVTAK